MVVPILIAASAMPFFMSVIVPGRIHIRVFVSSFVLFLSHFSKNYGFGV